MALAAVVWATPAAALRPAPVAGVAPSVAVDAQFRFPWEQRAKPKKRVKRSARPARPQQQKKPAAAKRGKGTPVVPAAPAAPVDPMDAALPPAPGPVDVAVPRGATPRERDGWMAVAVQIAPPSAPPLLPPEGPAPAPAYVAALLATMQRPEPVAVAPPPQSAAEDDETPDLHVPLPPVRPRMPGETAARDERPAMRDGLAPENGLAPEGGLSPEGVPLPPRRPGGVAGLEPEGPPEPPPGPTEPDIALPVVAHDDDPDCRALASEGVADANRIPAIEGPGVCGGGPLVLLEGVKRKDGGLVKIKPAATLRCSMARELAAFVRDDVAPAAQTAGGELVRLDIAGSFQCRGRNGAAGGKMSEHGRANAVDLSGVGFSDGRSFGIFAPDLPPGMSASVKAAACGRFSTVLGPGSDGFHESHLHLDMQPRRSKAKLCQWADPQVAKAPDETEKDGPSPEPDNKTEAPPKRKASATQPKGDGP